MNSSQPFDRCSHNPFATRFVRPGVIRFRFPVEESTHTLVKKLQAHRWHGEIVGPHGVGKSSLLATLLPEIAATGRELIHIALHDGERILPCDTPNWLSWTTNTLLAIDGYEQLSSWSRWKLVWQCWWRGAGILITTHRSFGIGPANR
jgi:hypothetical protein